MPGGQQMFKTRWVSISGCALERRILAQPIRQIAAAGRRKPIRGNSRHEPASDPGAGSSRARRRVSRAGRHGGHRVHQGALRAGGGAPPGHGRRPRKARLSEGRQRLVVGAFPARVGAGFPRGKCHTDQIWRASRQTRARAKADGALGCGPSRTGYLRDRDQCGEFEVPISCAATNLKFKTALESLACQSTFDSEARKPTVP